jgi:hypothetical protein
MSICSTRCMSAVDENPQAMHQRRKTVKHPFGTMKHEGAHARPRDEEPALA